MRNNTISRLLQLAKRQPLAPLLMTRGRNHSYAGFVQRACALSARLRDAGFVRGQRVALFLEEYDQFFISMMGVWFLGGVVIPINSRLPRRDKEWLVGHAKPNFVLFPSVDTQSISVPADRVLLYHVEEILESGRTVAADDLNPLMPDELAMIMFTSGTTGLPKGVCQTLDCISTNASSVALTIGLGKDDRIFLNTPPYFTSGICHFLTLLAAGGSVVAEAGFHFGEGLLGEMERRTCTGFGGAPAHLVRVLEPMTSPREHNFKFWISSGDHLPLSAAEKLSRVLPGVRLFNMYGLTEVGGRLCILVPEETNVGLGSVGRPIADMVVVARDPKGVRLPIDEIGELYVTGSLVMQGYLDEPEITARTVTDWGLRTGDFGRIDQAGNVWVVGRKDDIIKCGGEKVSLVRVQAALLELGTFSDAAAIAIPHKLLGHVPIAFVVPCNADSFNAKEALRELKALLPSASLPNRIVAVREIPRTGSGKAIRAKLQELLRGNN